jgi:hypothetical protein
MCYPGSLPLLPIQKLLNVVDHHLGGTSQENVKVGIDLFNQLNNAGTFIDYSNIDLVEKVFKENDLDYLANEFREVESDGNRAQDNVRTDIMKDTTLNSRATGVLIKDVKDCRI